MKKIVSLILAFAMLCGAAFALASCGDGGDSEPVVKVVDIALTEEQYAFAVPKGNSALLTEVNALLTEIKGNGKFDEILDKYFGDGTPTPVVSATERKTDGSQLIVATNAAFAPFEYMEGSNYYGVDLEIMALLAEKLDKELYIYNMDFDAVCLAVSSQGGSYEGENGNVAVQGGIADIAAAGLTINETRQQILDFSDSYYNASQMLVCAADDTTFDDCTTAEQVIAKLNTFGSDVKVGVQSGTTGQFFCEGDEGWGFDGFAFDTVPYQNGALATQNVINGNIKYVVIDEGPAKAIVEKFNEAN
jgi:polar amino acid transport system substrate-binding protein